MTKLTENLIISSRSTRMGLMNMIYNFMTFGNILALTVVSLPPPTQPLLCYDLQINTVYLCKQS